MRSPFTKGFDGHMAPMPAEMRATFEGMQDRGSFRCTLVDGWLSFNHLAVLWREQSGYDRLSICSTVVRVIGNGRVAYEDARLTWDDLQRIKHECGFGDRWAVEVLPPDDEVVNVSNMRHLFLLPEAPEFGWKAGR